MSQQCYALMLWTTDHNRVSIHHLKHIFSPKKPWNTYKIGETGKAVYPGVPGLWDFEILATGGLWNFEFIEVTVFFFVLLASLWFTGCILFYWLFYWGPPRGFGDSGRRAIYFQGFGEKGHLFSGILGDLGVLGSREQGKNILGSWVERSFFFQGAGSKDPPWEGPLYWSSGFAIVDIRP